MCWLFLFLKLVCFGFKRFYEVVWFFKWDGLEFKGVELNLIGIVMACGIFSALFPCKSKGDFIGFLLNTKVVIEVGSAKLVLGDKNGMIPLGIGWELINYRGTTLMRGAKIC